MKKKINENNILDIIKKSNYYPINKIILKSLGPLNSLVLIELLDTYWYFKEKNKLVKDEWFYRKYKTISNNIRIKESSIGITIKYFKDIKLIKTKQIGLPALIHYSLIKKTLYNIYNNKIICKENPLNLRKIIKNQDPLFRRGLDLVESRGLDLVESRGHIYKEKDIKSKNINTFFFKYIKKERELDSKKIEPIIQSKNILIDYWNNLDNTPKHKNPDKKIYKQIIVYFRYLKSGNILKKFELDRTYLKKNNIPINYLKQKWTDDQIKIGLLRLSKIYKVGNWPKDKSNLSRKLSDLIYNPRTKKSMFLFTFYNDLKLKTNESKINLKNLLNKEFNNFPKVDNRNQPYTNEDMEIIKTGYIKQFSKYTDLFSKIFKDLNFYDKKELTIRILKIIIEFEKIYLKENSLSMRMHLGKSSVAADSYINTCVGDPELFIRKYIEWLVDIKYINFKITVNMIGPNSNNWDEFYEHLRNRFGYTL